MGTPPDVPRPPAGVAEELQEVLSIDGYRLLVGPETVAVVGREVALSLPASHFDLLVSSYMDARGV